MSFFFFSRGKLKEKKTVQKMTLSPLMDWLIFFFLFVIYERLLPEEESLSSVKKPLPAIIQSRKRKRKKSLLHTGTPVHIIQSSFLSLTWSFSIFKRKKKSGGILLSTSAFSSSVPADSLINTRERIRGNMAF